MIVRLSSGADRDLAGINNYLAERSPSAARRMLQTIIGATDRLVIFPFSGRPGRIDGTRELVIPRTPYLALYEVADEVLILRVLHGAQRWPPE